MTTAQKAPVEATRRMNSIISSTGMPRRNSMSQPVGMRSHGIVELRMSERMMPRIDGADGGERGGLQRGDHAAADRAPDLGVDEDVPAAGVEHARAG